MRFVVVVGLLLFGCWLTPTHATITILETGERFSSRQDDDYGPLLWKGYQYAGRLQMLDGNLPLCPSNTNNNNNGSDDDDDTNKPQKKYRLIVPSDELPVALLARQGGCSTLEKLHFIQQHVEPANLVHYLILDGMSSSSHHHYHPHVVSNPLGPAVSPEVNLLEAVQPTAASFPDHLDCADDTRTTVTNGGTPATNTTTHSDCFRKRDETIPIHVLHVNFRTEYKLLDYLMHQSDELRQDGGPRLAIDSKINVNRISDNVALAVAALTLLAACLCSLGLLIQGNRQGWWEPPPPPPRRFWRRALPAG